MQGTVDTTRVTTMPTTPRLPFKLQEKLGDEAMTELATLLGDIGAESRAGFREVRDSIERLGTRLTELEVRMDARFADRDARMDAQFADRDARMDARFDQLTREIAGLKPQISAVQAELVKWTFLFWIGTIGLVLLLLRFPG